MYARGMSKMLQVRNVPDDVHERLRAQARRSGMSLSEYVGRALRRLADEATVEETLADAERTGGVFSFDEVNAIIRAERESR
jgi:plasmid stability protein